MKVHIFMLIILIIISLMSKSHNFLLVLTIIFYLLGRLCDDFAWYTWDGISQNTLQAIALGSLTLSAILTIARRSYEQGGIKLLFLQSQVRFKIPWALVITIVILLFNTFDSIGTPDAAQLTSDNNMSQTGLGLFTAVILLTNLNYSVMCNTKGDLPILIIYQIILFGEIIFNGTLLIKFINELIDKPKDYSIIFITIFIAWQVLVMDLLFREVYEQKKKQQQYQQLQLTIRKTNSTCQNRKKEKAQVASASDLVPYVEKINDHQQFQPIPKVKDLEIK